MAEESDRIKKVDTVSISSLQIIKNEKLPDPVQMVHSPTSCNEDKDMSSDELVIDLGQDDKKACSIVKKRKRNSTSESSEEALSLPQHCLEIEKKVSAVAAKNNLTSENVKNILKKVILNEHVLAVVKLREEEVQKETETFEIPNLKLTRAKTRELKKTSNSAVQWPLPITPVKVPLEPVLPEVKTLISEDLLDEESDDEYQPTQEEHSDEERDNLELSFDSDFLPKTPEDRKPETSEGRNVNEQIINDSIETPVKYTDDGLFKIPKEIENNIDAEAAATIALRTRSKLCLSDTPIEKIEESFIPPDIGFDDTFEVDYIWRDFIQDLPNPELVHNEDDDDADPEYNVAADFEPFDREELREDDEVEVSNKELNELVAELFDGIDTNFDIDNPILASNNDLISSLLETDNVNANLNPIPVQTINPEEKVCVDEIKISNFENCTNQQDQIFKYEVQIEDKKETFPISYSISFKLPENIPGKDIQISPSVPEVAIPADNSNLQQNCEKESDTDSQNCTTSYGIRPIRHRKLRKYPLFKMSTDYANWTTEKEDVRFLPDQLLLLEQQMRQHVQLLTQNYLQFYKHPTFKELASEQKEFLVSLKYLGDGKTNSAFVPCNLVPAIQLCNIWTENLDKNTWKIKEMLSQVSKEMIKMGMKRTKSSKYYGKFPPLFISTILESKNVFFYPEFLPDIPYRNDGYERKEYLKSEDQLIAMGLEQFYQYLFLNEKIVLTPDNLHLHKISELINKYLLPSILPNFLKSRIKRLKWKKDNNPISTFYTSGKAPETENEIIPYKTDMCVKDYPHTQFSGIWQKILRFYKSKKEQKTNTQTRHSIFNITNEENTPSFYTAPTKTVSFTMTPLLSTRAVKSPQQIETPSVSCTERISPNILKRLIEKASNSECECLKFLRDDDNQISLKNQPLITDFFQTDYTVSTPKKNVNEKCKRFRQFVEPIIKYKLEVLLSLPKKHDNSSKDSESVLINPSVNIRERFLQRIKFGSEMLMSCKSETSLSQNDYNGKDNRVLNKVCSKNNRSSEEIRDRKYAVEFFDKVKSRLGSVRTKSNPLTKFELFEKILQTFDLRLESPCKLFYKLETLFGRENEDLMEDFLMFLTPTQANIIDRFVDYFMMTCTTEFIEILQIFLANKPSQLCKILCCLENLAEIPKNELTIDRMKNSVLPLLKENQYLMGCFLKIFPDGRPPDSWINTCQEIIDLKESDTTTANRGILNMPNFENNFSLRICKCACHNLMDEQFKKQIRHCLACVNNYIQGRIHAHNNKSVRTVFLNWNTNTEIDETQSSSSSSSPRQENPRKRTSIEPDSDDERVSPKRNAKLLKTSTSKGKRSLTLKNLPKNNENNEVNLMRIKDCSIIISSDDQNIALGNKANDNPHKNDIEFEIVDEFADFKRQFREDEFVTEISVPDPTHENKEVNKTQTENCSENIETKYKIDVNSHKNDNLALRLHRGSEDVNLEIVEEFDDFKRRFRENESLNETSASNIVSENNETCVEDQQEKSRNPENSVFIKSEVTDIECGDNVCSELQDDVPIKCENPINNWTREEDKTILLILREEADPQYTINKIQELLPHRKLDEIKDRFENVLNLLQKISV